MKEPPLLPIYHEKKNLHKMTEILQEIGLLGELLSSRKPQKKESMNHPSLELINGLPL